MEQKRSLEITLDRRSMINSREAASRLGRAGIEVANWGPLFVQVRNTTPVEVRRVLRAAGATLRSVQDGFSR